MNEIIIETNGQRFDGWTKVSIQRNIENLCASFSFTTTSSQRIPFPVKQGESCKIFVNSILALTGWVEKITVQMDANSHSITVHGRDRTNDLVDSQLGEDVEFNPGSNLKTITEKVLKSLNLSHIKVIDRFNLGKFDESETDSMGITGFDFIERFAKKVQVLLTTNGDGDIVFERASKEKYLTVLSTEKDTVGDMISINLVLDDTKRFHEYSVNGQTNVASLSFIKASVLAKLNVSVEAKAIDKKIRTSRKFVFQPEDNGGVDDNLGRAKWEANFRRAQSMVYTATVQGFTPVHDEGIWEINKQIGVVDEFSNINDTNSTLLVTAVHFSQSVPDGSRTVLTMKTNDAYTSIVNKPEKDSQDQIESSILINRQPKSV